MFCAQSPFVVGFSISHYRNSYEIARISMESNKDSFHSSTVVFIGAFLNIWGWKYKVSLTRISLVGVFFYGLYHGVHHH